MARTGVCLPPIIIAWYLAFTESQYTGIGLRTVSDCSCIGYNTSYQCTTVGNGATKWHAYGTAFDCRNRITLLHERFSVPGGTTKHCNGGDIIGQSVGVEGNNYTSKLIVHVILELNDTTVECEYEDLSSNQEQPTLIGQKHLILTSEPLPPPDDTYLAAVTPHSLTFQWTAVANGCASLLYEIKTDCGICDHYNILTFVSCNVNVSHISKVCSFAVRSIVCGSIAGTWSNPVNTTLKVPEPIIIEAIQANYTSEGNLTALAIDFRGSNRDVFNISRGIDGYIHNFTIVYSDNLTNHSCAPLTTSSLNSSLPPSCFPTLLLNNNITVSISASNRLGKGKENSAVIAATNEYVHLSTSSERIICHGRESFNLSSCSASYGECGKPKQLRTLLGNTTESPTLIKIDLYPDMREYCYEVTATINYLTVIIRGNHSYYNKDGDGVQRQSRVIAAVISIFVAMHLFALILTVIVIVYRRYHVHTRGFHAIVELLDEPWQFLNLLQGVKDFNININDTEISGCTSKKTRRIYLQFDQNLSDEQAKLMKCQIDERISSASNAEVMESKITKTDELEIIDDRWTCSLFNGSYFKTYTYSRLLPPKPGALCTLIEGIQNLSTTEHGSYDRINVNITGIAGTPKEQGHVLIHLRFNCDHKLPRNWRKDFDNIEIC